VTYLVREFHWSEVVAVLRTADLLLLFGFVPLTVVIYWVIRAIRWHVILRNLGIRVTPGRLLFVSSASLALATFTPFRSGEVIKIEFLKRAGYLERARGYGSFALEKALDIGAILVVALVSAASVGAKAKTLGLWMAGFLALLVSVSLVLFLYKRRTSSRIGFFRSMVQSMGTWQQSVSLLVLTSCSWLTVAFGWQVSLHSIGVDVSFVRAIALVGTATLVNLTSMIPGALGISEVAIAEMLGYLGYRVDLAQAGALAIRLYGVLPLVLGGVLLILVKLKPFFRGAENRVT